ncbi:hypothetical protein J5Y09_09395 [Roseomonas sp. PWR1]|uniref:EAL domain-containing protein n=1 Tax=Roseomonas nitratireducens TaxID=2820810 RepID=A0ABS4ARY3_9PROT|nr:hypothetical protein [Neoroseomonas nitratireducens]MBP0464124.1 hypothetical protein [Neoroseomonas nitratireducens]
MTLAEANVISALGTPNGMAGAATLAALVRETVAAGVERRVLLFRPSGLAPARRRSPQMAMLREAWGGLRRTSRTRLFELPRGTMVALEAPPGHHLTETHGVLADMLEPAEAGAALALLRLPDQAAAVLAAIEEALGLAAAVRAATPRAGRAPDGDDIAATERAIASADISSFLRRRRVCRLTSGGGAPEPLWEDRRLALRDARDALLPGRDLDLAPALARRLRRALERRMLAGLAHAEELRDIGALSMPLLIESVTSGEFLRLDAMWPAALRGRLTIAFGAEDVAADPAGFAFARDYLATRGHKAMLEAAGPAALMAMPASRTGIGAVRLRWSEALPPLGSPAAEALRAAFPADRDAVVLSGVDRPAAIAWGWEMGITLFQGRLVETRRPMA